MDLVGAWLRQLLRAGTATAILPVVLLAALLVIAVGSGGLGGLDSLGQLVAGPGVPATDVAGPSPTENPRVAPVAPGARDAAPRRVSAATAAGSGGGTATPAPASSAPQQGAGRRIAPAPGSSSAVTPQEPAAPPLQPVTPPPPPPPAQQRPPQLGEVVAETVSNVIVGVKTLIDDLGRVLGLAPPP